MPVEHVTVTDAAGQRLDNFLLGYLKKVPKSRVYSMVRRGEVRVNGGRVRPQHRLASGDVVRIPPVRQDAAGARAAPGRLAAENLLQHVVFEDADLVVLDKPAGIAVHGGSGVDFGVIELLRAHDPTVRYELAHRIDRDTSGCLAVAKNRATLLDLHRQFQAGRVKKRYDLVVAGRWPRSIRGVRLRLKRYTLANGERRVRVDASGSPARTEFQIVEARSVVSWLVAHPHTGRTHQIRVHAAAQGHAILGDDKYAAAGDPGAPRLMLHATALAFEGRRFEAPVDAAFRDVWERLAAD